MSNKIRFVDSLKAGTYKVLTKDATLPSGSSATMNSLYADTIESPDVNLSGSFSGSFQGNGAELNNIPASAITGLNLNQISSGSVSASISPDRGLEVNTNLEVSGSITVQTISNATGSFLTTSPTGIIQQRTQAETLTDIGAQPLLTNPVTGTGKTNFFPIWSDGDNRILQDSQLEQDPLVNGAYQWRFNNTDRVIIDKPSSITSGDPEYLIAQDGTYKFSMGWDDDGAGFGYLYNWSGNGIRLGAAGANPVLEILTDNIDPRAYINGKVGIGIISPTEKLEVSGSIKADNFIKSGSTSDDILLGDGTTTSLSNIETQISSIPGILEIQIFS